MEENKNNDATNPEISSPKSVEIKPEFKPQPAHLNIDSDAVNNLDENCPLKIGFKAGEISDSPERFNIVGSKFGEFLAFEKPSRILIDSYISSPNIDKMSVVKAMRENSDKPEFKRFGMSSPWSVNQLDYEMSGVALVALNKDRSAAMRNAVWSGFFTFEYFLLARAPEKKLRDDFVCDLPIFYPENWARWRVSHAAGKKSSTRFVLAESVGEWQLWKAFANIVRPHQIRVHAGESGIRIAGERLYSRTDLPYLSKIKKKYILPKDTEEKPLYDSVMVHLSALEFDGNGAGLPELGKFRAEAALPKGFSVTLKKLGFTAK